MNLNDITKFSVGLSSDELRSLVRDALVESNRLPGDLEENQVRISFPPTGGANISVNRNGFTPRKPRTPKATAPTA